MSQGKRYTFQRQGLENTIISVIRGQGKSGNFFSKACIHPVLIHPICDVISDTNRLRVSLGPFGNCIIVDHKILVVYVCIQHLTYLRMVHEEDTFDLQRYRFTGLVNVAHYLSLFSKRFTAMRS